MSDSLLARIRTPRVIAGAVALALAVGAGGWWLWQRDQLPADAAFRIDGTVVTVKEVEQRAATLKALYGVEVPAAAGEKKEFWRDTAQSMALSHIVEGAADELNVAIPSRTSQQALSKYVTTYFGAGSEGRDAFVAALAAQGTSEEKVRDEVTRHLLLTKLFAEVTAHVQAPGADAVRTAYDDRHCQLATPETRTISNIVVVSKAEARAAMADLRSGTPFAEVARNRSADGSTAEAGGDLGTVSRDDLEKSYAERAFTVKTGKVFGPVRSDHGWNIGIVTAVQKPQDPAFGEVKEQLAAVLLYEAQAGAWRAWLQERLEETDVDYADEYQPTDPKGLPESMSDPTGAGSVCGSGK